MQYYFQFFRYRRNIQRYRLYKAVQALGLTGSSGDKELSPVTYTADFKLSLFLSYAQVRALTLKDEIDYNKEKQ
jgi:hypothetical protein